MSGDGRYQVDRQLADQPACKRTGSCCVHGSSREVAVRLAAAGAVDTTSLARAAQIGYRRANAVLKDAVRDGKLVKVGRGLYALPGGPAR